MGRGRTQPARQGAVAVFLGKIFRGEPSRFGATGKWYAIICISTIWFPHLWPALPIAHRQRARESSTLAAARGVSLNELVGMLEQTCGPARRSTYTPARKTDVPRIVLDVSRIREHLGWSPRISMEQGLQRTWDWIVASEEGAR